MYKVAILVDQKLPERNFLGLYLSMFVIKSLFCSNLSFFLSPHLGCFTSEGQELCQFNLKKESLLSIYSVAQAVPGIRCAKMTTQTHDPHSRGSRSVSSAPLPIWEMVIWPVLGP